MVFFNCLLSAVVLTLSLPRTDLFLLAWVALVPSLYLLNGVKSWRAFRRLWLCGFLFFLISLGWLMYVTPIGLLLLSAYLALFFGIFGAAFVYFQRLPIVPRLLVLSAVWVVLEYIRGHFLSGMGWVMLGHTQSQNLWTIQIADTTGIYGISFLVILVNLLVTETWRARQWLPQATVMVVGILMAVIGYGLHAIYDHADLPTIKVGLVQPNIALEDDWDDAKKPQIVDKTIQLTQELKDQHPDLIVWPETSLPGEIADAPLLVYEIRQTAVAMHSSLLMGTVAQEGNQYYNSAFQIAADGQIKGRYDKIHLVPFGEYLPVRPLLGWIDKFVPIDDFTPGRDFKIFSLGPHKKFGVLICFEDTLGDLCRHFARQGAGFFVNMTNDAWFLNTRQPYLHLQEAVFGCVENHRALARAANTGVSALIDPWGHVQGILADDKGRQTFASGIAWGDVAVNESETFYTKFGDIFTCLCFLCILGGVFVRKFPL